MITDIKKRDGSVVLFEQIKITNAIHKAIKAIDKKDGKLALKFSNEAIKILEQETGQSIPSVELVQDIVVRVLSSHDKKLSEAYQQYRQKRTQIREAKFVVNVNGEKIRLTKNAVKVLESRYLIKDENGKLIETPEQLFKRVARNIALAERIFDKSTTDDRVQLIQDQIYEMMGRLEFLPNSPTLMNAGAPLQQLSACFVLSMDDSMESIFETVKEAALIHKTGGGTGFNFSKLRPRGDMVKSTSGVASGPISFMKVVDAATESIKQGGKRRGANMGILNADHPDLLEFITCKSDGTTLQNFNISVGAPDKFIEAALNNEKWSLVNPRNQKKIKEINAGETFDIIVSNAWETGDPGFLFLDKMNDWRGNSTPALGRIVTTNPCGEVPMFAYESCNLGSINLDKVLIQKSNKYEIDWEKLKKLVHLCIRFLDNVIEMNKYPLPEIDAMSKAQRRLGLGIMGWADILIRLEIPYNSEEAIKLGEKLMSFFDKEAREASSKLAEERGVFPNYQYSVYPAKGVKMRNCALTTIAPTGTIGIIAACSQGIEPIFALAYIRKSYIGKGLDPVDLVEVNPLFEEVAKREGFYSEELMKQVAQHGTVQDIQEVPEKWRKVFVTAHDLSPEDHIKMQAAFQKYIDNAVSKTINFKSTATKEDVKKAYILAWKLGCKGITIYRDLSKAQQVLNIPGHLEKKEESQKPPELKDPLPDGPEIEAGECLVCDK